MYPSPGRVAFEWTEPVVPEGWHGAFSDRAGNERSGTLVYIHP